MEEKTTKNKSNVKQCIKNHKKKIISISIGIIILIIVFVLVFALGDKKQNNKNNDNSVSDNENSNSNEYVFTEEDAINVIKAMYSGDNYKFEAKAKPDNMYEVVVINIETNTADVYEVDPTDGSYIYLTNIGEE